MGGWKECAASGLRTTEETRGLSTTYDTRSQISTVAEIGELCSFLRGRTYQTDLRTGFYRSAPAKNSVQFEVVRSPPAAARSARFTPPGLPKTLFGSKVGW